MDSKVAVLQKVVGTVELIVDSSSILLNCPILIHHLMTKKEFTMANALMQECSFQIDKDECTIRLADSEACASKSHLLACLAPMEKEITDKTKMYTDVRPAIAEDILEQPKSKEEEEGVLSYDY